MATFPFQETDVEIPVAVSSTVPNTQVLADLKHLTSLYEEMLLTSEGR